MLHMLHSFSVLVSQNYPLCSTTEDKSDWYLYNDTKEYRYDTYTYTELISNRYRLKVQSLILNIPNNTPI